MFRKFKIQALIVFIFLLVSCSGESDIDEKYPGNQIDLVDPVAMPDSSMQADTTSRNPGSGNTIDRDPVNKGEIIDTMSSQRH